MKPFSTSVPAMLFIMAALFFGRDLSIGIVKDIDGNVYPTVKIGNQWWMAENPRTTRAPDGRPIEGYFFDDDEAVNSRFGRLYTWDTAMNGGKQAGARGIAPEGWHIPSDADWQALYEHLKANQLSGLELLRAGRTGFNALLEGGADFRGNYLYKGEFSMYWSSTEVNEQRANHHGVGVDGKIDVFAAMKGARIHIRCVKDE